MEAMTFYYHIWFSKGKGFINIRKVWTLNSWQSRTFLNYFVVSPIVQFFSKEKM